MTNSEFEKTAPEEVGLSSRAILEYIEAMERKQRFLHGFVILRGDKVAAEGYWKPFYKGQLHRMYSSSKSFVSIAIGFLCDEGKISLDDKICDYFKDMLPEKVHPYLAETTIRDLLRMESPYSTGTTYKHTDPDWTWTFFNSKPDHPSGTVYNYDTSASHVLGVLVERLTGKPFLEYLKDKALRRMGFSENAYCIKSPEGYSWGGSGVICSTMDLAKTAKLVMDGGMWNGERLLSEEYAHSASTYQVDNAFEGHPCDSHYGYGYQIWMYGDDMFAFRGMGGQVAFCIPGKKLVLAINADTQNNNRGYKTMQSDFVRYVADTASDAPLPCDREGYSALEKKLSSLEYPHMEGMLHTECETRICGKTFELDCNPMGIKNIRFEFSEESGTMYFENAQGKKELPFGIGKYVECEFPQDGYFGDTIGKDAGRRYHCICSGAWTEQNKLKIKADIADEYFGNLTMTFGFKGDLVGVCMSKCAEWFLNEYSGFAGGRII